MPLLQAQTGPHPPRPAFEPANDGWTTNELYFLCRSTQWRLENYFFFVFKAWKLVVLTVLSRCSNLDSFHPGRRSNFPHSKRPSSNECPSEFYMTVSDVRSKFFLFQCACIGGSDCPLGDVSHPTWTRRPPIPSEQRVPRSRKHPCLSFPS